MKKVKGISLGSLPISGLSYVRDLEYFDGPILTQYEHPHGDHYLYYWCDCDDKKNRWMILRVTEANILRLINRVIPLDLVIPKECQDDYVYFVDKDSYGATKNVLLTDTSDIPEDYVPKEGAYLEGSVQLVNEKTYSVLVEGGWSIRDLGSFPRVFSQAYSVLYGLNVLHIPHFEHFPWRGGFSAMHFFNWVSDKIPSKDRPRVNTIQYASPGFMRFSLHGKTALQVMDCVEIYKNSAKTVGESYADLTAYIRQNKLNEIESKNDLKWNPHDSELKKWAEEIMSGYGVVDSKGFTRACSSSFEAAKIAMAFYRRIRELVNFEKDGLVRFPNVSPTS